MPVKYDFGCGNHKMEGFIGIDINPASQADIIWDLTAPCPEIPDGSADFVWSAHVMEHIPYPKNIDFFAEILRVLKVGGQFTLIVPHPGHDSAMVPDHKHWYTMQYIDDVLRPFPTVRFDLVECPKTPLFYKIQEALPQLTEDDIVTGFRNVATTIVMHGTRV